MLILSNNPIGDQANDFLKMVAPVIGDWASYPVGDAPAAGQGVHALIAGNQVSKTDVANANPSKPVVAVDEKKLTPAQKLALISGGMPRSLPTHFMRLNELIYQSGPLIPNMTQASLADYKRIVDFCQVHSPVYDDVTNTATASAIGTTMTALITKPMILAKTAKMLSRAGTAIVWNEPIYVPKFRATISSSEKDTKRGVTVDVSISFYTPEGLNQNDFTFLAEPGTSNNLLEAVINQLGWQMCSGRHVARPIVVTDTQPIRIDLVSFQPDLTLTLTLPGRLSDDVEAFNRKMEKGN